jgi:hypothetical protein
MTPPWHHVELPLGDLIDTCSAHAQLLADLCQAPPVGLQPQDGFGSDLGSTSTSRVSCSMAYAQASDCSIGSVEKLPIHLAQL